MSQLQRDESAGSTGDGTETDSLTELSESEATGEIGRAHV